MMRAGLMAALVLAGFAAAAPSAPVKVGPAAERFRLGAVELVALRDAVNAVPNDGKVFGTDVGPATVAGALRAAGAPAGTLPLGVDALLVRLPGRTVLIDTGLGPKAGGGLLPSLAMAGVGPGAVTDVLVTHSHGDHVGGLVGADGALAFPRAAVRMSAAEWAYMQGHGDPALVAAVRPQVRPFAPGAAVLPGIRSVSLPGHTPGHVGYEIASGPARLLDIGDLAHSAVVSLAHPEWAIGYDGDAAAGKATRAAELARLAESREPVFAPHFPFPGIGRIVRRGAGYGWVPGHP
jgi:glyoxylase-like metal-dependent hydrolase (beta-lactamase superfamily II)